mgnify:CR=1 FL=1
MEINLDSIPLLDNHAHPFPSKRAENKPFVQILAQAIWEQEPENVYNSLMFHMYTNQLKEFLGLPLTASIDEMLEVRNARLLGNRKEYINSLFHDANLMGMIADVGFPLSKRLNEEEIREFDDDMEGFVQKKINRVELVCEDILEEGVISFEEFTERYVNGIKAMALDQKLVALKSIIAYRTGLDIRVHSDQNAKKYYYLYLSDPSKREYEKVLRDYCFTKACEVCAELDIPLQVHTGIGDTPLLNVYNTNPALMFDVLNAYRSTKIVLIHAGYPHCEVLGFLMNHYDNVYGDTSLMIPFAGQAGDTKLKALLEMAPTNKLMYGSDGGFIPEHVWYGAKMFRVYLRDTLQYLVDKKYITYDFAMTSARNIMYENAKRLYKI